MMVHSRGMKSRRRSVCALQTAKPTAKPICAACASSHPCSPIERHEFCLRFFLFDSVWRQKQQETESVEGNILNGLDEFRRRVLDDPDLHARLRSSEPGADFVSMCVREARAAGIELAPGDIEAGLRIARRDWIERWVP